MSETHLELLMNMPYLSMNFLTLLENNKNKKFSKKHYKSIILKFINSYNFDNMNIDKSRLIETVNKYGDNLIKSSIDTLEKKYNKLTEQLNTQFGGSNQKFNNKVGEYLKNLAASAALAFEAEQRRIVSKISNWLEGEKIINLLTYQVLHGNTNAGIFIYLITNYGREYVYTLDDRNKYLFHESDDGPHKFELINDPMNLTEEYISLISAPKPSSIISRGEQNVGENGNKELYDKWRGRASSTLIMDLHLYFHNILNNFKKFHPNISYNFKLPRITPPEMSTITNTQIPRLNTQLLDNNYSNRSQDFLYIQITMIFVLCLFIFYNKDKLFKKIKSLLITEIETREQWASRITETYRPTSINNNLNNNLNSNLKLRRYGPETISDDLELGQDSEENQFSHNSIFTPSRIRSKKNISRNMELERIKRELDVIQSPNPSYYTDTTKHEYTNRSKKKYFNKKNESLRNINNFNNLL